MDNWGYVIKDMAGNSMYEEYGFQSKPDAEAAGKKKKETDFAKSMCFVKTQQRWNEPEI